MKYISLFVLVVIGNVFALSAQEELNIYGNLSFGPHRVGFKQVTHSYQTNGSIRALDINMWYPAEKDGKKLKFSDYLNYKNELSDLELLETISIGISGKTNTFPKDSLELLLHSQMKASQSAEPKKDKYPLLVWSSRYGTVEYQNILSEYLTSHGYVVAFVEDKPNAPFPWQIQSTEQKEIALNRQVADLTNTISFLKQKNNIDKTKIGLLSWSYAGESVVLAQMSDSNIDAIIGLSSIGFSWGVFLGAAISEKVSPEKLNVPYLILSERIGTNGKTKTPPDIFNEMHPKSRYVSFEGLSHGSFNALEGMIPGILKTNKVQPWSKGGEIAQIGYEVICKITQNFLDAIFYKSNLVVFDEDIEKLEENLFPNTISVSIPKK